MRRGCLGTCRPDETNGWGLSPKNTMGPSPRAEHLRSDARGHSLICGRGTGPWTAPHLGVGHNPLSGQRHSDNVVNPIRRTIAHSTCRHSALHGHGWGYDVNLWNFLKFQRHGGSQPSYMDRCLDGQPGRVSLSPTSATGFPGAALTRFTLVRLLESLIRVVRLFLTSGVAQTKT